MRKGDYQFEGGRLRRLSNRLPLHPNHKLLYETVLDLAPQTVIEFGCGGGDHLFNLSILAPDISLYGRDLSDNQLKFLRQRHPALQADLQQLDVTQLLQTGGLAVDVAYTQAVIMHIKTGESHIAALTNLFKISKKQVVLMENWTTHPFLEDIKRLEQEKKLPWANVHYYYRRSSDQGEKTTIMIISAVPLGYEPLIDYGTLL